MNLLTTHYFHPAKSRRLARMGVDDESIKLSVMAMEPGWSWMGRFVPPFFARDKTKLRFLPLTTHHWPGSDIPYSGCEAYAVCRRQTHRDLLEGTEGKTDCAACEAGVPIRKSGVAYFLREGSDKQRGGVGIKFTEQNLEVLRSLINDGCFDLARGRKVRIWANEGWKLAYELLEADPIEAEEIETVSTFEDLGYYRKIVNVERVSAMAKAKLAWEKLRQPAPDAAAVYRLKKQLPYSTLIPIPFGCKGPTDLAWQDTPFGLMASGQYLERCSQCNLGLLAGRDPSAGKEGLPNRITLIIDPDEQQFFQDFYRLNKAWLDDTFCVKGARGAKWIYQVEYEGNEGQLQGTKIMRRTEEGEHELVGERLSSGEQGVVYGLHPSGVFYQPNDRPLLVIRPRDFRLPKNCYLTSIADELASQMGGGKGRQRTAGPILNVGQLQNRVTRGKDVYAACPACREEGYDSAGDNLLVFGDGRYICSRFINDTPSARHRHNQAIYRLVGLNRRDYE